MTAILGGQFAKNCNSFYKDCFDTVLYQIHSEILENSHFRIFAIFSNGSRRPSWTAQSHKFEKTPFADHSD